jgi:hypothetical protein
VRKTQGRKLIEVLKRQPLSYWDMLNLNISMSPWKRVVESLAPDEELVKGTHYDGFVTWRVVRATKWTA